MAAQLLEGARHMGRNDRAAEPQSDRQPACDDGLRDPAKPPVSVVKPQAHTPWHAVLSYHGNMMFAFRSATKMSSVAVFIPAQQTPFQTVIGKTCSAATGDELR
jgi:hypothetical protein